MKKLGKLWRQLKYVLFQRIAKRMFIETTSVFDFLTYSITRMFKLRSMETEKSVVFVSEWVQHRIPRIARSIKSETDFRIVFLCHVVSPVDNHTKKCFDKFFHYRNKWHLLTILFKNRNNIYVIHSFGPKSYYAKVIIESGLYRLVHDLQDVVINTYKNSLPIAWMKKDAPNEKYCFENANGLISQSVQIWQGLKLHNVINKPDTLFFPIYCDDSAFTFNKRNVNINDIHLVYIGSIATENDDDNLYSPYKLHRLIERLADQKIHVHIYPPPIVIGKTFEDYVLLSKQNPYFHFHSSVNQDQVAIEISKYDFGIIPFFKDECQFSPELYKRAATLKLFNYLEAGLPIIVSEDLEFQNWIINRYKVGFSVSRISIANLRSTIETSNYMQLKSRVLRNREKIVLRDQVPRLLEFYDKVAS